jgi:DNA-binding IclR family transcriptional regulator
MPLETGYLDRALALLDAIVRDRGQRSLSEIAKSMHLPLATAHRLAQRLVSTGYLVRSRRGYYHAGPVLAHLRQALDEAEVAVGIARPFLERLARRFGCTAHLGRFDQDMVTYLLKTGHAQNDLFTKETMQQEAYCSGLGKALLSGLGKDRLESYLAGGPFIRLTPNTIVDEGELRKEIALTRARGYAIDNCEISDGLFCVAVPLKDETGDVFAAMSLSFTDASVSPDNCQPVVAALKAVAGRIRPSLLS